MSHYKKIPIWENCRRLKMLIEFRNLIKDYFHNIERYDYGIKEYHTAYSLRPKINLYLETICSFVKSTEINTKINHYYRITDYIEEKVGSDVKSNVLSNIFILWDKFSLNEEGLLDCIDRAMGIYKYDKLSAIFRTINPLFWIGLLIDYLVSLPFKFFGKIGFEQEKIESSKLGKTIKGFLLFIYYLTVFITSLLTILFLTGYLNKFMSLIKN